MNDDEQTVANLKLDEFKMLMNDYISTLFGQRGDEDYKLKLLVSVLDDKHKCQMQTLDMLIQNKINQQKEIYDYEINFLKEKYKHLEEELKEQISKNNTKIQTGECFVEFQCNRHYMNTGTGERSFIKHINFDIEYEKIPHVMASINGLDGTSVLRIMVEAFNITTSGFDINIKTWCDSRIFGVKVSWISFQ